MPQVVAMKKWKVQALSELHRAAANPAGVNISKSALAGLCGVSRWTLWRDDDIRAAYARLIDLQRNSTRRNRSNLSDRVRELTQKNEELKRQNEALLQNFIIVTRRLMERGIDPVGILGVFAPNQAEDTWKHQILGWTDQ
jgi:hypothetical protein